MIDGASPRSGELQMRKLLANQVEMSSHIAEMSDTEFARFLYCQHIASTHLAVAQFENMLISAMLTCDKVKLENALGADMKPLAKLLAKHGILRDSTWGSLISILARHSVADADIGYLRWVKDKRDYFVHRMFHDDVWPGDLNADECHGMARRLMAIQIWLERAQRKIWLIFERAGFVEFSDHDKGILARNSFYSPSKHRIE